jgi:malate dehydrogenase (oxaloacetate-decarboxylating)(NADP+)
MPSTSRSTKAIPDKLVDIIALHPTFGGINLEDIKAPECFYIERKLRERLAIPVFHDDQHGTAIVVGAGMLNAIEMTGRDIASVKIVCSGAGAAAMACLDLLVDLGAARQHLRLRQQGRADRGAQPRWRKAAWAQDTTPHAVRVMKVPTYSSAYPVRALSPPISSA